MKLAALGRYPVKSLGGHCLQAAEVEPRGLAGDRRWMLVDPDGRFMTRREVPAMARLSARCDGDHLLLSHPDLGAHRVGVPRHGAPIVEARVWRDHLPVRCAGSEVDAYLARALGRPARLVHQHDASRRPIDHRHADADQHVSLADGYPILLATEASLAALNERLDTPVPMERFRPNLVIAGAEPWAEDRWRRVRVGQAVLRIARACSRCVVITQQPSTGERLEGNEPLATLLKTGRKGKSGAIFGQNAIAEQLG